MNVENIWGTIHFNSFESVVSWLCSCVPYYFIVVFVLGCFFAILDVLIHLGGRK